MSIPSHKASGDDGIGIKILKIAAPAIVPSLTRVLNFCLTRKYFLRRWKIAKVSPIFKRNGCKNEKECFRPISLLPTLSKLLEKLICRSLNNFLNGNNILYKNFSPVSGKTSSPKPHYKACRPTYWILIKTMSLDLRYRKHSI